MKALKDPEVLVRGLFESVIGQNLRARGLAEGISQIRITAQGF